MEKKTYSKVYTQFETHLVVFQSTEDSYKPIPILTVVVKASETAAEVGFTQTSPTEVLVVGMDIAWKIMDFVAPLLRTARG